MHSTTFFTALLALGVSAAPSNTNTPRGYGLCDTDADCEKNFKCENQWEGDKWSPAINVCIYDYKEKAKRLNDGSGAGLCNKDSDCVANFVCEEKWAGGWGAPSISVCVNPNNDKKSKREVVNEEIAKRGYGLCSKDSDCNKGWHCEEQWEGNEWAGPISVCVD